MVLVIKYIYFIHNNLKANKLIKTFANDIFVVYFWNTVVSYFVTLAVILNYSFFLCYVERSEGFVLIRIP